MLFILKSTSYQRIVEAKIAGGILAPDSGSYNLLAKNNT